MNATVGTRRLQYIKDGEHAPSDARSFFLPVHVVFLNVEQLIGHLLWERLKEELH